VPESFSVSLPQVDVLIEKLRIGRFLYPFEIPFAGTTVDAREKHRAEVWELLKEQGVAHGDELRPDPERVLRLWATPPVLVTLEAREIEENADYLYRAGWDATLGVYSQQRGYDLIFEPMVPDHVVPALLNQLPRVPPFPGRGASVVIPARPPVNTGIGALDKELRQELGPAQRFFDYPLLRIGRIAVTVRDSTGKPRQDSIQWFDSVPGRFMITGETLNGGDQRQTFSPTDGSHLARWIYDRTAGL
jgi:hypothetical protein